MAARQYHMKVGSSAAAGVDSYLEYKRIVGDDDGGVTLAPKDYDAYIKRLPEERPIKQPCTTNGCRCATYHYVPVNGSRPVRCRCKHFPEEHRAKAPHRCENERCECEDFKTAFTCGCGEPAYNHTMLVETKQERIARGHPVGQDTIYQAMGGITGFSSMLDGYMRLDPSGIGAPSKEFLEQPITASDHPFLRGHAESVKAHRLAIGAPNADADLAERMSAMRRPRETDMEFYERRYKERQKAERLAARIAVPAIGQKTGLRITKAKAIGASSSTGGPSTSNTGGPSTESASSSRTGGMAISGSAMHSSTGTAGTKGASGGAKPKIVLKTKKKP